MGLLTAIQGKRIYLDTNIWIYALEGFPASAQDLTALFQAIDLGTLTAVTSELSFAEVLVKPMQNKNATQQAIYKQAISSTQNLSIIPVGREILIAAAELRAITNLKLPDAIHAATALSSQCSTFLTNDRRFQAISSLSLQVIVLSQIIHF